VIKYSPIYSSFNHLFINISNRNCPLLFLGLQIYYAGLRVDEVRNVKWVDMDFEREIIHVKVAKGEKESVVFLHSELRYLLKFYGGKLACVCVRKRQDV